MTAVSTPASLYTRGSASYLTRLPSRSLTSHNHSQPADIDWGKNADIMERRLTSGFESLAM